jgi:hypothetical protein
MAGGVTQAQGVVANDPQIAAITGGNVEYNLSQSGIPFVKTPTGSMASNGAMTSGTALPRVYSSGAYFWMPAGSIAAGVPAAASWYWGVASSTTAVTLYNSTYTSGTPAVGVQTAFATTGPGAFTGDTGTITCFSIPLPAAAMGINGRVETRFGASFTNSAGSKTAIFKLGSGTLYSASFTTQGSVAGVAFAQNRGVTNAQAVGVLFGNAAAAALGQVGTDLAIDTTAASTVSATVSTGVATDWAVMEEYAIRVAQ